MKIRTSFVSNSSSTSFVLDVSKLSEETKNKIDKLVERSDDLTRCTGRVTNIQEWLKMFNPEFYMPSELKTVANLLTKYKELIIIRESDEEMGGSFENINLNKKDFEDSILYEFEYH